MTTSSRSGRLGGDTRQAVRRLVHVIENLSREVQQLRIEQYGLRGEIAQLRRSLTPTWPYTLEQLHAIEERISFQQREG